jgi:hypothetical protein
MKSALKWGSAAQAALMLLGGCTLPVRPPPPQAPVEAVEQPKEEWRTIATDDDADRIDRVEEAWAAALGEARAQGFRNAIRNEAELLDPAAGLPRPELSPGPYRCRVVKLGTQGRGPAFTPYKPFFCYVEAEGPLLTIVKQTGSQRPAGRIYPDSKENRLIFLGTLALGDEETLAYGERRERDMAGIVERVAPFRYRVVIPWPQFESKLDVYELVPVVQ